MTRLRVAAILLLAVLTTFASETSAGTRGHPKNYCYSCPRDSHGRIKRSSSARRSFLKSKGLAHKPLSKGGTDTPGNMQLLCGDELKAKERSERK